MNRLIKEAERGRAEIFGPTGNNFNQRDDGQFLTQAQMDDDFFHHIAHIDNNMMQKIEKWEYIDLAKLLPREKIIHSDGRLQMIHKDQGGSLYIHAFGAHDRQRSSPDN